MKRLLAKSYDRQKHGDEPPDYALLTQHSRDVAAACNALAPTAGLIALLNAELGEEVFERFSSMLRANGWIQDLGKASSHFQEMVRGERNIRQLVRHETISGLLILSESQPFRAWLLGALPDKLLVVSVWGAMGHHRKFDRHTKPEPGASSLIVHLAHDDFTTILIEMSDDLNISPPPECRRNVLVAQTSKEPCDIAAREAIRDLQDDFTEREAEFKDEKDRRLLALVKGFGIAADVAASAVAAREQSARKYALENFVVDSLRVGLSSDDMSKLINNWAWNNCDVSSAQRDTNILPHGFTTRPFQDEVAASDSYLTIAEAGCGSGKSLAAYMWARGWCGKFAQDERNNFRLFFCLPTTGTTTEHFKDYALESGIDASLRSLTHSRASVDLRAIAETAPQEDAGEEERDPSAQARATLNAERDKIESLALWSTPLVVTTSDTVLGLMSNARRAVYSLPAIMSSVIVFDEIHAFDEQLFGHLLIFLKNFPKLPVLLMTASLPEQRLLAIKNVRPDLNRIAGPPDFEQLERYRIQDDATGAAVEKAVEDCVAAGGKVLWVRNRVEWANETYRACRAKFPGVAVNVYHSRLRYKDRAKRHRRVIDNFKSDGGAAILVATQVAEMSLNLSADLLITDIAPVPSLIQRMGRLNRRMTPDTPEEERTSKPAFICSLPEGERGVEKPYEKAELEAAESWLASLRTLNRPLSQRDLSEAFARISESEAFDIVKAEKAAVFFSGLWQTRPGLTRGEGYTVSVILEGDLDACDEREKWGDPTRDWIRRHEVAVPIKDEVLKWERVAGLRVAPRGAIAYDYDEKTEEGTGARWQRS